MEAVTLVVACWLLFAGTHVGLVAGPIRSRLVAWLGEGVFRVAFFAIAAVAFTCLMRSYAVHQHEGPLGLGAFVGPALRPVLWALAGLGATLSVAGLVAYPASPMEMTTHGVPRPTRLARITRHPFFAGVALVAVTHAVLATHATGTAFFAGLAVFTILGMWHQDRKLLALRGEPYAAYCRQTSVVPFAAIVSGRTRLEARDVPVVALGIGVLGATALRWGHPHLLAWDGMGIVAAVVGGATFFSVMGLVRLALRAGQGRALAAAGAVLVLHVGLAHEVVGARLYPDGPALLGGPVAWHGLGAFAIVTGVLLLGQALGLLAVPTRVIATTMIPVGLAFVVVDAVLHGGFHFFAATLVVGAWLVRTASVDPTARGASAQA